MEDSMKNDVKKREEPPSLYSGEEGEVDGAKGMTLLSALEPVSRRKRRLERRAWMAVLLLLVAVPVIYWGAISARSEISFGPMIATPASSQHTTPLITDAAAIPDGKSKGPALIVTETENVADRVPLAKSTDVLDVAESVDRHVFPPKAVGKAPVSVQEVKANKNTGRKDRDVELIAALLAYEPSTGTGKSAATSASERHGERTGTSAKTVRVDPGKDVVTRVAEESTESLVKRCRALGWLEGELCRFRVCSGQWGKDAACPASASQAANN